MVCNPWSELANMRIRESVHEFCSMVSAISLVPRTARDDNYCLKGKGMLGIRKKFFDCKDFVKGIFSKGGEGHTLPKIHFLLCVI